MCGPKLQEPSSEIFSVPAVTCVGLDFVCTASMQLLTIDRSLSNNINQERAG